MGMKERADGIYSNSLKFFALLSQSQIRFSSNKQKHSIPPPKKQEYGTFPGAARVKSKPIPVDFSRLWDWMKPGLFFSFFPMSALVSSCISDQVSQYSQNLSQQLTPLRPIRQDSRSTL